MSKLLNCAYRGSRVARYLAAFCKKAQQGLVNCLKAEEELFHFPMMAAGVLLASAVSANVILSLLLGKHIGMAGWAVRGLLFLAGISAVSSKATWQQMKGSSIILTKGFLWITREAVYRRRTTAKKK